MKTILFTNPSSINHELSLINDLFSVGLEELVVRKPEWKETDYQDFFNQINKANHSKITICDQPDMVFKYSLNGLHCSISFYDSIARLEQHKMHRRLKESGQHISISAHNPKEWNHRKGKFDQLYLCPIFPSISKPGYSGDWDDEWIKKELRTKQVEKIIALGGIQLNNIARVQDMGFDGIGVLGTIWNQPEKAVEQFILLQKIIRSICLSSKNVE